MTRPVIPEWPQRGLRGAKRANITHSDWQRDWFVGFGKDQSCQFEGTWWDMICFARNVLASENTRLAAPEFHRPDWKNDNYTGPEPYDMSLVGIQSAADQTGGAA